MQGLNSPAFARPVPSSQVLRGKNPACPVWNRTGRLPEALFQQHHFSDHAKRGGAFRGELDIYVLVLL
ncbi:MAG: hypothetical protein D6715_13270 [Calditrichaeota bacterium]|nr:MAG: hypothetical protein D6715_13270 [Calditrichota bacterium]